MLASVLLSALVLGAPAEDDAARKMLRVAYASQYEWKEDRIDKVLLEFRFLRHYTSPKGGESESGGRGHILVIGGKVVRIHFQGERASLPGKEYGYLPATLREQVASHVGWVVRRFVRRPFEEAFKGVKLEGPEPYADGVFQRIKIRGMNIIINKAGQIQGREVYLPAVFRAKKPEYAHVFVKYEVGELRDGYAILGERYTYTMKVKGEDQKVGERRSLKPRFLDGVPMPLSYSSLRGLHDGGKLRFEIEFEKPQLGLEDPVVLDAAARDLLKAAWQRRYVLPPQIHVEGEYKRTVDKSLARDGWPDNLEGAFHIRGLEQIEVDVEEGRGRNEGWRKWQAEVSLGHFRWFFDTVRERPFEKEFENCGFEAHESKPGETVVQVFGYPRALAFRLRGGSIVGALENSMDADRWWTFKLKAIGGDRDLIDRMGREAGGKTRTVRFVYGRTKGYYMPRKFQVIGWGRSGPGIVSYVLRKVNVELPE